MQSNDELYSTDINPVIAAYGGYDNDQPGITNPGESDKDPHEMMPVAGANETVEDEDTVHEEDTDDEQELADAEDASGTMEDTAAADTNDDTYYDASAVEGNAPALNKSSSITNADDESGVY